MADYLTDTAAGSRIKRNLVANFIGNGWSALASFVAVPLYVHFLGVEAFGLVGFFTVLLTLASLFQMGLGAALTRELAWLSARPGTAQQARDLSRSVEVVFWAGAAVAGMGIVAGSAWIAEHWLRPVALEPRSVARSLQFMGLALALQWPYGMYSGGLLGLQKQVLLNAIAITGITFRIVGSILVLWRVSPTLEAFFAWQVVASGVQTALGAIGFWRSLPPATTAGRFSVTRLKTVWRFAGGMATISVLSLILIQMDKVVVSRLLSLETLGYYTVAGVGAGVLYRIGGPVFGAVYPRLTQLVALGDESGVAALYHRSSQLLAILILPAGLLVMTFSREAILLWTQNSAVAENASPILSLLACGTALHALMSLPYALQLAHGWTRLGVFTNATSAVILLPLLVIFVDRFGAVGAAGVWVLLNVGFFFVNVQVMHRRLLPGHQWRWYAKDVGRPLVAALAIVVPARFLLSGDGGSLWMFLVWLPVVWLASASAAVLVTPGLRTFVPLALRRRIAA